VPTLVQCGLKLDPRLVYRARRLEAIGSHAIYGRSRTDEHCQLAKYMVVGVGHFTDDFGRVTIMKHTLVREINQDMAARGTSHGSADW